MCKKLKYTKEQEKRHPKTGELDWIRCDAPIWSKQHDCPATGKNPVTNHLATTSGKPKWTNGTP